MSKKIKINFHIDKVSNGFIIREAIGESKPQLEMVAETIEKVLEIASNHIKEELEQIEDIPDKEITHHEAMSEPYANSSGKLFKEETKNQ